MSDTLWAVEVKYVGPVNGVILSRIILIAATSDYEAVSTAFNQMQAEGISGGWTSRVWLIADSLHKTP